MTDLILFPIVLVAPLVLATLLRRWQYAIFGAMIWMVFEGAFRKWFFPGLQGPLYFVKDAILLVGIVGFIIDRRPSGVHEPLLVGLRVILIISFAYFMLQIANPNSPSPLLGLLGLKSYMLYSALMFIVPHAFVSVADFERRLNLYMLCMIPVALLALVQFAAPADSFINTQVAHDGGTTASIAVFGEDNRVRTSGTFAYIGGFATFIEAMLALSLAYPLSGRSDLKKNLVPFSLIAATILAMFTTGSRTVVFSALAMGVMMVLIVSRAGLITTAATFRIIVVGGSLFGLVGYFAQDAVSAFEHRAANSDDPVMRLLSPITEFLDVLEIGPVFGLGIGVTANASSTIMGTTNQWWLQGIPAEGEAARVCAEVGLPGVVLVYLMRGLLFFTALRMVGRLRAPLFKAIAAAVASFFALHIVVFVINNPTAGLYYWFAAGLLYAMFRLENETLDRTVLQTYGARHHPVVPR